MCQVAPECDGQAASCVCQSGLVGGGGAGRPYIVQGQSLVPRATPSATARSLDAHEDGWGSPQGDLGSRQPVGGHAAKSGGKDGLAAKLLAESLRDTATGTDPFPQVAGTLSLEDRLPELLAAAQEHVATLPTAERTHWHEAGLAEHASVGSFARLCLELLVAGAPPRLVRQAVEAQEEELLHAHIAFGLANSGVQDTVARGRGSQLQFPAHTLDIKFDPTAMRAAAIADGLQSEGHSALELFRRALKAIADDQPGGRSFAELTWAMARDEARHASLASDIIAWLSDSGHAHMAPPQIVVQSGSVKVSEL